MEVARLLLCGFFFSVFFPFVGVSLDVYLCLRIRWKFIHLFFYNDNKRRIR